MKRLARRLFMLCSALSLVLCVAVFVLWVRSYSLAHAVSVRRSVWPSADVCVNQYLSVRLVQGYWVVVRGRSDYDVSRPAGVRFHHAMDVATFRKRYAAGVEWDHFSFDLKQRPAMDPLLGVPRRYGFGLKDVAPATFLGVTEASHYAVAPVWPAVVVLAVLPAAWTARAMRRRRRACAGLCPACGYDLRASPGRCPECGTSTSAAGPDGAAADAAG